MNLTKEQQAYFAEIAAQLVATHGEKAAEVLAADPVAAVTAAHQKRQDFIQEILDQRTDRSKMAKKALCAAVYADAVCRGAVATAIEHCEHIADHSWRRSVGMA